MYIIQPQTFLVQATTSQHDQSTMCPDGCVCLFVYYTESTVYNTKYRISSQSNQTQNMTFSLINQKCNNFLENSNRGDSWRRDSCLTVNTAGVRNSLLFLPDTTAEQHLAISCRHCLFAPFLLNIWLVLFSCVWDNERHKQTAIFSMICGFTYGHKEPTLTPCSDSHYVYCVWSLQRR